VGFFLGTLFVGYYAPAYSLGNLITFFILPISFVLFPAVSKSYDEQKIDQVRTKLRYSLKYFLVIAIPAVFGMSVLTQSLLEIFTTKEIALQGLLVTPFIALSILFYGASDVFSQILTLVKKTKIVGVTWALAALLNIMLNLFLIPSLGIFGAALATLAAYLFAFLLIWHYSFKELAFTIDWQVIVKIILCSAAMSVLVFTISPHGLLMTIVTIAVSAVLYGILILLTKVFAQKELSFLKDLVKR